MLLGVLQPKPAFLLKTGNECTQRTKECVFKGWKQETKESSVGHKKRSSRLRGGTGVCVSSLSNQANPGEKTILD